MDRACLGVVGTVHEAAEASMNRGSRAHGARLNCSKQFAVAEPVITEVLSGFAQRDDFGVGRGIVVGEIAIPSPTDYSPVADDHRSHGHFARVQGALGAAECLQHPEFVGGVVSRQFSVLSFQMCARTVSPDCRLKNPF
jgi:hypothetical protein